MLKPVKLLFFLSLAFLCACGGSGASDRDSAKLENGKVVIVFGDRPDQEKSVRGMNVRHSLLSFIDVDGSLVEVEPRQVGGDTVEVPVFHGYAEVLHKYQAHEYAPFLLMEGDTVLVSYDAQDRPVMNSLVYEKNTTLYNLPYTTPGAIQNFGYYIEFLLTDHTFYRTYAYFHDPKLRAKYGPELAEALRPTYVDLDSLSVVCGQYQERLRSEMDSLQKEQVLDSVYYRYLSKRFFLDNRHTPREVVQNDSLLHYISNYDLALWYAVTLPVKHDSAPACFDLIAQDTVVTPLARKMILKKQFNEILTDEGGYRHYSKDFKARYAQRYTEITGDSLVLQQVLKTALDVASLDTSLPLETVDGEKVRLEDMLEKHRGRLVYVDFWASWCAPCLGQIPSAKALHKRLAGQDVDFVFISTDTKQKDWLRKAKENADVMVESYRILDNDAIFMKQVQLDKIPRFMIFDRNGKLVDLDAPRPSDERIDATLLSLLK